MALHVLHRLIVPRHPPCALKSNKSNTKTHTNTHHKRCASGEQQNHKKLDTRVHYTVLKQHEHHPHNQPQRSVTQDSIPTGTTTHAIPDTQQRNKPNNTKLVNTTTHTNNQQTVTGGHASKPPSKGFLMPTIHPQKIINKNSLERR